MFDLQVQSDANETNVVVAVGVDRDRLNAATAVQMVDQHCD